MLVLCQKREVCKKNYSSKITKTIADLSAIRGERKKMRKKIAIALAVLTVAVTGCSNSSDEPLFGIDVESEESSFALVAEYNAFDIIYDKETGVMYTMSNRSYTYGVLTPLLNSDGTPKIYQK